MSDEMVASLVLSEFVKEVCQLDRDSQTLAFYTPHDISHIKGVEQSIDMLLSLQVGGSQVPTPLERLLLSFCAWSHDLGMFRKVADRFYESQRSLGRRKYRSAEQMRRDHDLASAYYLQERGPSILKKVVWQLRPGDQLNPSHHPERGRDYYRDITLKEASRYYHLDDLESRVESFLRDLGDPQHENRILAKNSNLIHTVNLISRYHRRAEVIGDCPKVRDLFRQPVRAQFLAAIFRGWPMLCILTVRGFRKEILIFIEPCRSLVKRIEFIGSRVRLFHRFELMLREIQYIFRQIFLGAVGLILVPARC